MADKKKLDDILETAKKQFETCLDADSKEREKAAEDILFHDGEGQWDPAVKKFREGSNPPRPCITINKIPEKVDQVEGDFRQAAPSTTVIGVDSKADPKVAEIYQGIINHIRYNSTAKYTYIRAYNSQLIAGRGSWRINIQDSEDDTFDRDIVIEPLLNSFSVYVDPKSKRPDRSDAQYQFVTEWMTRKQFETKFPGEVVESWESSDPQDTINWYSKDEVRVCEYFWKEQVKKTLFQVRRQVMDQETGQPRDDTIFTYTPGPQDQVVNQKDKTVTVVKWAKLTYWGIIKNEVREWPSKYIPIINVFGKETVVEGKIRSRGMVRHAKEPGRLYNYIRSSQTEQIAMAPKAPFMLTPAMIQNHEKMWNDFPNKNYPYMLFNPDPNFPGSWPHKEVPPQVASGYVMESQALEHEINGAMGLYRPSLGDESNEKSGKAIIARQREGDVGAFAFMDNFALGLTYESKILIDLIPKIYDTERVVRIMGEDMGEKLVPINMSPASPEIGRFQDQAYNGPMTQNSAYFNDLSVGKYDVRVRIGPSYTTQRQEAADVLLNFMDKIPSAAQAIMDLAAKNLDFPGADEMYKRLKKLVPIGVRDPDPEEAEAMKNQEKEPSPEQQALEHQMVMEDREQTRKEMETFIKTLKEQTASILNLAKAEAQEKGNQLAEYKAALDSIMAEFNMRNQIRQGQQAQPQLPQGGPPNEAQPS